MTKIELYSAMLCPYAHRSRLTLIEKQIPFTLTEIDLCNKPPKIICFWNCYRLSFLLNISHS